MGDPTKESAAFIDLDAALAERNLQPVTVKFGGKTFELPTSLTAEAMLAAFRLEDDATNTDRAIANMKLVLTEEVFDDLIAAGIAWSDLVEVVAQLTQYYMFGDNADDEDADTGEGDDSPSR